MVSNNFFLRSFLQLLLADDDLIHCPSAPNDAIIETSNAFLGLRPNVDRETLKILPPGGLEELEEEERRMEAQKAAAESEKKASTTAPQQLIRMSTRDADQKPIPADEFIRHRDAAMRKIVSSKYGSFKYNYGGYIPQSIIRKKIEEEQNVLFRLTDYISHLRLYTSDFILDILVDEEAEMEARKIEEEERKRKRKEEEDRERLEQEVAKKLAERKKMLEFSEGMWNPGVMEYLSEIHEKDAAIKKRSPQSGLENYTPDQLRFSLQTPFNTAGGDANMGELLASNRASMVMPPASRRASVAFPPSSSPIMNAAGESRVTTSGGTPSPLGVPVSMVRRTSLALQDTSGFNQRRSSHAAQELAELNNARRTSTAERASVTSIPEGGLDSATIRRTSVSAGHADADALGAETVDVGGAVILEVPEIEGYRNSEVLETDSNGALISEDALNDR